MSKLRSLNTSFWSDPFIEDLEPLHKLLFIYLITNEKTNMLGIYEASIKKISFETGIKKETVSKGLKAFESIGKVKYINNYVVLLNFMKHQNYNTNMKKSAIDIYNNLPKELKSNDLAICKSNPSEGFERLLSHYGMVSKIEVEVEREIEEIKEIKKEVFNFRKELIKLGCDSNLAEDWIKVRKNKKASNTLTAFKALKKQFDICGLDINKIIEQCVVNSWSGFKSEWIKGTIKEKVTIDNWQTNPYNEDN